MNINDLYETAQLEKEEEQLEESLKKIVKNEAKKYEGTGRLPEFFALQINNKNSVFFVMEPNNFFMIREMNGKIMEQRKVDNLNEVERLIDEFMARGYRPVDPKIYIKTSLKTWALWMSVGALSFYFVPVLAYVAIAGAVTAFTGKVIYDNRHKLKKKKKKTPDAESDQKSDKDDGQSSDGGSGENR